MFLLGWPMVESGLESKVGFLSFLVFFGGSFRFRSFVLFFFAVCHRWNLWLFPLLFFSLFILFFLMTFPNLTQPPFVVTNTSLFHVSSENLVIHQYTGMY